MNRIHHFFRASVFAAVFCLSGAGLYAQSTVDEIVRAQSSGNDFNVFIDPYALELFGDSVIASLNSDADASWNTWKDVLTNGNSPGMDVNFDGNTAYGIDSLLVAGAAELDSTLQVDGYVRFSDSLYVALYAYFAANLEVAGNTDVTGNLSVTGTATAASGSSIGSLTLADGSITDSSGAISFGDEALSTTGTLASGTQTVTGNVTASGTVQAEQLTSTDDLTVTDVANIDGTLDLATGSITDQTGSISFGDEALSTTGTAATGALTVTGTGAFSSTTSSASGSTVGNLTLADGSITDSSGAISFGDEALSTSGTLASGTQTVTGNVTASGTVEAEQLTSTDDLTVTDVANIDGTLDLATGSITDSSGAISFGDEALSTTGTAATGALTVTGTGSFSSTTSSASGSTVGNLTLADGSITDSSGAISFGDEALSTTGTLASGTQTVTGNVIASGTVQAEQLTSTDDLTIADVANIDGTLDLATGSITDQTGAISFGDEALSTTGTAATGALTVTGTGSFSSTTSSASGSTVGNLTLADGSITDSSGAISFGDEALSTTGTLASGTQTVTGNVTASGTVEAEQLTSTDDLTVTDVANIDGTLDLATGSITDQTGSISFGDEALSTTGTAATGALTVTGTGSFSSTTSSASGSTVGNLTLADGSITDSSGAISFDDEALSTTGTAATGALTVTGTGSFSSTTSSASGSTVGNLTLADGSITDSSGAISFGDEALSTTGTLASGTQTVTGNVTASGTVQAEQLTSTDDLTVADVANIDGTLDLATGSITDQTGAISFGDDNLSTTGNLDISSGTLTLADNQISGDKVEGGTIAAITISQLSGAMDVNSQSMTNVNIDSGNIDGATIATSDVTVGAGKTLDVSAGTLTLAGGQVTADKVGGGFYPTSTYQHTASILNYATTTMNLTAFAGFNAAAGTSMDIDGTLDVSDADLGLAAGQVGADKVGAGTFDAGTYSFAGSTISDFGTVTTADINGGTIDGTTIATSDVTVGAGKTLDVSAGTLTLAAGQVTADKIGAGTFDAGTYSFAGSTTSDLGTVTTADINGGTIDGATIATSDVTVGLGKTLDVSAGALTLAAGQVTADKVGAGTFNAGTYTFASSTISDLGTVTTADINGGTIDGATIATSDVTVGAGKTLDVSAGALTLAAGQVTADKVGAGTFNAGTYSFAGSTISDLGDVADAYIHGGLITDTYITISSSGYLATNPGSTVDLSNAILTLDDDQISGDAIDGGTIGAVTINQLNLASGAESPATRSTVLGQLIAAASSTDQPASAAPYNTGTYIDLPPGKWNVFINMQTDQGYNSTLTHGAGAGGGSIAVGLSTSNVTYTPIASQFHTESIVGGSLDGDHSIYDMIQGQRLINQSSGSTVRLYLWVKSIVDSSGNTSTSPSTWTKPGSDAWDLNSLYAVPVNW